MNEKPEALRLADEYADAVATHRLESLYGTSKYYTLEKARERDEAHDALTAELRRLHAENEALRKDAERWKMTIEIGQDVLRHPDCRKIPASVSAYMDAIHNGYDMTYAVDAAIDATIQKGQP